MPWNNKFIQCTNNDRSLRVILDICMENEFAVGMDNLVKTDQKFNKKTKFLVEMAKSVEIDRFDQ